MSRRVTVGVSIWAIVVIVALVWGRSAVPPEARVGAAPLVGTWQWHPGVRLIPAVVLGAGLVLGLPLAARRLRWPLLLGVVAVAAPVWALALAAGDGWDQLTVPLTTRYEYEPFAATIQDGPEFLRTYTERIEGFPVHVRGHPPVTTLVPWTLDRLGLPGPGWLAALCIAAWGAAVTAPLAAARMIAGETWARQAAPAMTVLPAAVWVATSVDALVAGVAAVAVAVLVVAFARRQLALAAVGGVAMAGGLLLSYGVAPLGLPVAMTAVVRRTWAGAAVAAGVGAATLVVVAAVGFNWFTGLAATRAEYLDGISMRRPAPYFALAGNPAALALATGPAVAAGLALARRRSIWLLPLGAVAAVAVADISLLSKGEVERIWLPFVPWLALATGALGPSRRWVAAQVGLALVLQAWLVTPW